MTKNIPKNTIKHTQKDNTQTTQNMDKNPSKGLVIKVLSWIFGAKYLEHEYVLQNIPFFIFLTMIGIIYISSGNIADSKIRDINKLNRELKELRSEYIITKSELMFLSKQSELAKRLEPIGIKETTEQPYLIITNDTTLSIY